MSLAGWIESTRAGQKRSEKLSDTNKSHAAMCMVTGADHGPVSPLRDTHRA